MSEPFVGQIQPYGFNFAPRGWAFCDGQLLAVSQNDALFSLLGTIYGGDGRTTFGLPDLRGRFPMHMGSGPGLSTRKIGQKSGAERETLTVNQLPSHNHAATTGSLTAQLHAGGSDADQQSPSGHALGTTTSESIYVNDTPGETMAAGSVTVSGNVTVQNTGGSQSFSIMNPFLVINWCIALFGIYPSRS